MKKIFAFACLACMLVTALSAQQPDQLDNAVRNAVGELVSRLDRRMDISIRAITYGETNTTSDLSYALDMLIKYYADSVYNTRVQVVPLPRGPKTLNEREKGIVTGTFTQRGNTVEIFLNLLSDINGKILGSAIIRIPIAVLRERGIAIEPPVPPNPGAPQELELIFTDLADGNTPDRQTPNSNQTAQNIRIEAWFDSESRTYMHGDELEIYIWADRNCYFKIYHIDANNRMKLIFPNNIEPQSASSNYLRANETRPVFNNSSVILYGPYGTENILIIASTERFANIEREYVTAWTATAETIRTTVMGESRGSDVEAPRRPLSFSGVGEWRTSITIRKPDEEYEYRRLSASDIRDAIQAMRNDALQHGGDFTGNYTSGFYYTANNIRCSYRVPRDMPDALEFAIYYQDNNTGAPNTGVQTRGMGSDYRFSFEKPRNMGQAVQMVRNGIVDGQGGTFTGNEHQGSFRANGIAGRYLVTTVVEVTITEKPFPIPNSLIEREIKNYFGAR